MLYTSREEVTTINQFQAIGIIIKSPNYYDTHDTPFVTFTIKIERDYKSKQDKPIYDFLNCKAFGAIAQSIHDFTNMKISSLSTDISNQGDTKRRRMAVHYRIGDCTHSEPFISSVIKTIPKFKFVQ